MVVPVATSLSYSWSYFINGSSPWEFSITSNHSPYVYTFRQRWQYKHNEINLFAGGEMRVTISYVCFHPQRYKGERRVSCGEIDQRDSSFFDSPSQAKCPTLNREVNQMVVSPRQGLSGTLGGIKSLSLFRPNDNLQDTLRRVVMGT